jgi:hypothetical protein
MKKNLSALWLSLFVLSVLVSCQKDESASPQSDNAAASLANARAAKIAICHSFNGSAPTTIYVTEGALANHLKHGDSLGECGTVVTPN